MQLLPVIKMLLISLMLSLLLLSYSVAITAGACTERSCPLGQFYNDTTGSCSNTCYPDYGNWTTGNCTKGS